MQEDLPEWESDRVVDEGRFSSMEVGVLQGVTLARFELKTHRRSAMADSSSKVLRGAQERVLSVHPRTRSLLVPRSRRLVRDAGSYLVETLTMRGWCVSEDARPISLLSAMTLQVARASERSRSVLVAGAIVGSSSRARDRRVGWGSGSTGCDRLARALSHSRGEVS